ncbi:DEAD/DEAH box helicase family protein [Bernardetia sp. Wsw4-3y2]|uniref:EcoAI/FtnUII family type I restriction enzme subunit R n=1 Tax=Bernardetia sp. Wsw4-3y2 TaxID=3127471 RepID=UPI0030CFD212
MNDKKNLSEADIKAKFITPAILQSGWDEHTQIGREIYFTAGRIQVEKKMSYRQEAKFADYILYYKPNIPIAIIEAKSNKHSVQSGIQQALNYAAILDIPCVFSSNGDGFYFHDKTADPEKGEQIEQELSLENFPSPMLLWEKYKKYKGIETKEVEKIATQDYDLGKNKPRYYQQIAINRTVEAVAKGQDRVLLVMATGTGKTFTAYNIINRLWKSGAKKRILFLADRNALIDQAAKKDFLPFGEAMTRIKHKKIDKAFNVYLAIYQGLTENNSPLTESNDAYKEFSRDFFDLIIIDECHRGSAREDSKWREILDYFDSATHIGLTATPKETATVSNMDYFGEPIYTYSLKQGIDDGFLAPYKVVKVTLDIDAEGWRPETGFLDKKGQPVEDRMYNQTDFDRNIIIEGRRELVAKKITEFLKGHGRFAKTIVFCVDIEHAEGMRKAIINQNKDLVKENHKYVMKITGDDKEGKLELENFTSASQKYPVIVTTSKLLTTGIDATTCQLIVLDSNIGSMTEFKQIIGRGTRVNEEYEKMYFTIMDFRRATDLFADKDFDGEPVMIKQADQDEDLSTVEENETSNTNETDFDSKNETETDILGGGEIVGGRKEKIRIDGITPKILNEREQYLGKDGKIITQNLKQYSQKKIKNSYKSLENFLTKWNETEKKKVIIEELEKQGIHFKDLKRSVGKEYDAFDLICHVAFEAKPLTRKERADNVVKRNYFAKYEAQTQEVIQNLLKKYADEGLSDLEDTSLLRLDPFNKLGTPLQLIQLFGGREKYLEAIKELQNELYNIA